MLQSVGGEHQHRERDFSEMPALYLLQGMMFLSPPTNRINEFVGPRLDVNLNQLDKSLVSRVDATELRHLRSNRSVSKRAARVYPVLHISCCAQEAVVADRASAVIGGDLDVASYYLGWQEAQNNAYHELTNPAGCIQLGLSENQVGSGTDLTLLHCFALIRFESSPVRTELWKKMRLECKMSK